MGWMKTIMLYASGNTTLDNALIDESHQKNLSSICKDANRLSIPIKWWETFGACTLNLMKRRIRALTQGTSASPCERNWSTFKLIHTKRQNRLSPSHV